jgi:hypothetical protein
VRSREGEQAVELEVAVADRAGVGRAAARVLVDEVADDRAELVLQVHRLERDAELRGDHARVARVGDRAAALLGRFVLLDVHAVAHEQAHEIAALLPQHPGRDRGIDAAAHGDDQARGALDCGSEVHLP